LAVRQAEAVAEALGVSAEIGPRQLVVTRVAGLDDLAVQRVRTAQDRGREAVRRHDVLPVRGLAVEPAQLRARGLLELRHVEADSLQRRTVPRLDAHLV